MSKKLKIKANVEVNGNLNLDAKTPESKLTIETGSKKIGLHHKNESVEMATYLSDAEWGASIGTLGAHKFNIFTGGTGKYKLTVDKGGNVGIGTSDPSEKFTIKTELGEIGLLHEHDKVKLGTCVSTETNGASIGTIGNHNFSIFTGGKGKYKLTIDKGGKVGIGTLNPKYKLTVEATGFGIVQKWGTLEVGTFANRERGAFGTKSNHPIHFLVGDKYKATIGKNGNMRIGDGTGEPVKARLVVSGSSTSAFTLKKRYGVLKTGGADTFKPSSGEGTFKYSIYADGDIACGIIRAFSDKRIKTINGISNSQNDLKILSQIEITDYTHIDVIGKGQESHKKAIAQQVKTVFPQAVSTDLKDFIPNIYTKSEIKDGWIALTTDVKIDDRIKLVFSDEVKEVKVLEKLDDMFKVETDKEGEVFVYGKEVSDFHTVDYDAISMLNVSATQEILKRLELVEVENQQLREDLSSLSQGVRTTKV
ncbi:MAG: tail fiber domain-containing protein [Crocinitomicaceae bacterium]|nr:tail fiber domain-containing protein [Flavobacteriales bacterium]NQZ34876.1 tail fiber domain-containing protein [Crocinitomicaceae bacterium]